MDEKPDSERQEIQDNMDLEARQKHIVDFLFFFFKQKTAYEIGTGDWSSDVCSSDLVIYLRSLLFI